MKDYRQLIKELPSNTIVCAVGEFSLPTVEHELMVKTVKKLAEQKGSDHVIYTSPSKNNVIQEDKKEHYLNLMFPNTSFRTTTSITESIISLSKRYKNVVLVVCGEQSASLRKLIKESTSIQIISTSDKDLEADSSKMKTLAVKGIFEEFKKKLPSSVRELDSRRLMNDVRINLGLDPIKEQINLIKDDIREQYFRGEIFNEGDIVESNGNKYTIAKRGSNHLLLREDSGKLISKWIQDVTKTEEEDMKNLTEGPIQPNGTDKIDTATPQPADQGTNLKKTKKGFLTFYNYQKNNVTKEELDNFSRKALLKQKLAHMKNSHKFSGAAIANKLRSIRAEETEEEKADRKKQLLTFKQMAKTSGLSEADVHPLIESNAELDKHISDFSKGVKSSASKHTIYKRSGSTISNMKHVETDADHQKIFNHLKSLGYKKMSGYDPKPNQFDVHHNRDEMTSKSDPVNHSSGISAHVETEHGGKTKVHFQHRGIKETHILDPKIAEKIKHGLALRKRMMQDMNEGTTETPTGRIHKKDDWEEYPSTFKDKDSDKLLKPSDRHRLNKAIPSNDKIKEEQDLEEAKSASARLQNAFAQAKLERERRERAGAALLNKKPAEKETTALPNQKPFDPFFNEQESMIADYTKQKVKVATPDTEPDWEQPEDISDDQLDKMVNGLSDEELMDCYQDDEVSEIDEETGEEVTDDEENVDALMEVISRAERIKLKNRFRRTKSKRQRSTKIALKRYSNTETINKRSRRLAIKLMKKRMLRGRDPSKISVGEKERLEKSISANRGNVGRLAMKLVGRLRRVEKDRMSHGHFTKSASSGIPSF